MSLLPHSDGGPNVRPKTQLMIQGMLGIGDNIHTRAVVRELMKTCDCCLSTPIPAIFHDLIEQGLRCTPRATSLRAQAAAMKHGAPFFSRSSFSRSTRGVRITYAGQVKRHGTLLRAMFKGVGLEMPEQPDFAMPVPDEWRATARAKIESWRADKPLLIYRPIVLRREWFAEARNPLPEPYGELFKPLRERFFVVSIANLAPGVEWIVGAEQDADVKLHRGELDFQTMAALFAEASLVYTCPGFAPTLAQAVGTPVISIHGGAESYRMNIIVGAHLAPTLGIDADRACECYTNHHKCDKRISIAPAAARIAEFITSHVAV